MLQLLNFPRLKKPMADRQQQEPLATILVVDDEDEIRDAYRDVLEPSHGATTHPIPLFESARPGDREISEKKHFRVISASQGAEAVDLLRSTRDAGQSVQATFLDIRMPPGIDGLETAKRLHRAQARARRNGAGTRMKHPFKSSLDSSKNQFYAPPQPPRPTKRPTGSAPIIVPYSGTSG